MKVIVENYPNVRFSKKITIRAASPSGHQNRRAGVRFIDVVGMVLGQGIDRSGPTGFVLSVATPHVAGVAQLTSGVSGYDPGRHQRESVATGEMRRVHAGLG